VTDNVSGFDCNQADTGTKYNVKDLTCISDEGDSKWIKISKITKNERRLCLKKFTGDGCQDISPDPSDKMEPQQLVVRKPSLSSHIV
jgi:hypothetical protein